ncbi:MAG: serine/threonine protein kinase [Acidobacteriota bacterium]|nr:MAG: serine/threonine protein kinase [Acidobacteriota bacterium]
MNDKDKTDPPLAKQSTASDTVRPETHGTARESRFIGSYRLLQHLGEGGMGEVWEAEQTESVRRRVALKLIKPGMDSRQVLARFEAERQAMALMDHPVIARVFDAGVTPQGRPFFAMEYVHGEPITKYCDRHRLRTRERLELFMQVCEGVQHAHHKGVIHRDLKPSNVLVSIQDERPVAKIIDFGVAKATQQPLTAQTLFTELGQIIGTPEYMSPEQAEMTGLDVDTRSDVYSLGVLLYELLVGVLPFDSKQLRRSGVEEIRRRIREEEPSKPSTRISRADRAASSEAAKHRRTEASALERRLRGDLDWITMKALEKDRTRRYGSPAELAADIRRHLDHEPVLAGPPSAAYRAKKFVRRHRLGVTAGVFVVAALVLGMIGTSVGMVRATRAEARALREAESKTRVSEFLKELFTVSDPSEARGSSITARELLDKAAGTIDETVVDEETRAELMDTMGEVYLALGLHEQAESLLERAVETRRRVLGDEHPDTLSSIDHMGILHHERGELDEAEAEFANVLEVRLRILGEDHPDTLSVISSMGSALLGQSRLDEAELYLRQALAGQRRILGDDHTDTMRTIFSLGTVLYQRGELSEAEPYYREALEGRRRILGNDHPHTLASIGSIGVLLHQQGKLAEAERYLLESLELRRRIFGNDHPDTLRAIQYVGTMLFYQNEFDEAEPLIREAYEGRRRVLGEEHPDTLESCHTLGLLRVKQGRLDEAEAYYSEAVDGFRRVVGEEHFHTLYAMAGQAYLYWKQGREETEAYFRDVIERMRRVLGPEHPQTLQCMGLLGEYYRQKGWEQAESYLGEVVDRMRRVLGEEHPITLLNMGRLVELYRDQGREDEAQRLEDQIAALRGRSGQK